MRSENPGELHRLPVGAVVIYTDKLAELRAKLVIVQLTRDEEGTPLYVLGEKPIAPPPPEHTMFSRPYLAYRMLVGWFVGEAVATNIKDTDERVKVRPFDAERFA
ncbi:hypothetical protein [Pararobbsia silviterrae]|uniref:Uncharacterized protein n=1 Tax=Pararobbsia silviterrae TaxID=1792498 RepID=A0A494X1Q3_9BURK|nr:hypothetical protein [Pararobbsia silviterrae]RKP44658.1 hypothetical protein D7S86_26880 [Pararobbsia silviterrae]